MRALGMHETVMEVMVNVLGGGDSKVYFFFLMDVLCVKIVLALKCKYKIGANTIMNCCVLFFILAFLQQEIRFPRVVTNCCRFLCYFCRISRQNQRSMFDHLSYLLQNSGIGLGNCCFVFLILFLFCCISW